MPYARILQFPLAALFILQPLVVYIASYESEQCDDKAVHFYAAMYSSAGAEGRADFEAMVVPFIRASETDERWPRTNFRLRSPVYYPLSNFAISFFHGPGRTYGESVKWGLFAITAVAVLAVVAVGSATPLGFLPVVLVLTLIAFRVVPADPVTATLRDGVHPMVSWVPRGAGATVVLTTMLAFGARRWWLFAFSLVFVSLYHVALGLLVAILAGVAAALYRVFDCVGPRYRYGLFALGVAGGISSLFRTGFLGALVYLHGRLQESGEAGDFDGRVFRFGLLFLYALVAAAAVISVPQVSDLVQALSGLSERHVGQIPERLAGCTYAAFVMCMVVGVRRWFPVLAERRPTWMRVIPHLRPVPVMVAILIVIGGSHAAMYARVVRGETGFARGTCDHEAVMLPERLSELTLDREDEPRLFLSLGEYIRGFPERTVDE